MFRNLRHELLSEKGLILDFSGVNMLDAGGSHCLEQFCNEMQKKGVKLIITSVQFQPMKAMVKSKFAQKHPEVDFEKNLDDALAYAKTGHKAEEITA